MTLKELKVQIEDSSYASNNCIIFQCQDNYFIADKYAQSISKLKNLEICYIDSIDDLCCDSEDIFEDSSNLTQQYLYILKSDEFKYSNIKLTQMNNLIVMTKKIDTETSQMFAHLIIAIPKLVSWQIKDYVYSKLKGIKSTNLDWLLQVCSDNIYRIDNEINKISVFQNSLREAIFESMLEDDMYSDISQYNIFNLSNAINLKDKETIKKIYKQKDILDISDLGCLSLLCQNFRNLILVQLNSSPTADSTGLSDKQIYAISRIPRKYSKEKILNIYKQLTNLDYRIKNGDIPIDMLLDYILIIILGD